MNRESGERKENIRSLPNAYSEKSIAHSSCRGNDRKDGKLKNSKLAMVLFLILLDLRLAKLMNVKLHWL
jgi:hypothetical protein